MSLQLHVLCTSSGRGVTVNKSLLQGNFLSTIEECPQEEDLVVHEDVTLRSGGEIEEVNEKEEVE